MGISSLGLFTISNHSVFGILQPLNCMMSTFHSFKVREQSGRQRFYNVTFDLIMFSRRNRGNWSRGGCANDHVT